MVGYGRLMGANESGSENGSRALAIDPDDALTQYNVACGYTKLEQFEVAFDLLERSILAAGPEIAGWVKHDSDLGALRGHPRYERLLGMAAQHQAKIA